MILEPENQMNLSISICIPTYKRAKLFKEALYSVIEQALQPMQIIIGDDSPDNITEILQGIRKECIPLILVKTIAGWRVAALIKQSGAGA